MADAKILATIERTDTEQLQISVSEYKGRSYLNMRIFYTTDDGATWLPTKKGVTFTPDQLDILTEAIEEAKLTLKYLEGKQLEYPVYIDTEDNHNTKKYSKESQYSIGKNRLTKVINAYCNACLNAK